MSSADVTLQWFSCEVTLGSILLCVKVTYNSYIYLHKPEIAYTSFFLNYRVNLILFESGKRSIRKIVNYSVPFSQVCLFIYIVKKTEF